ncbi:MAG: methyltransferase domain-containing protein [Alphaproteobacteria bacterium]|nr:methyltransferase domain-containing protein [Alphaproteobacteria bacterium]
MNRKERRAASKRSPVAGGALDPAQTAQIFADAVRLHQTGRTFDAEALCRAVLSRDAGHAGALHLLGVVAMQRGLPDQAVGHFRKAAESRPDIAIGHHSLGKALAAAGQPDGAARAFEQALAVKPDFAEAYKDLGVVLMTQGRFTAASARFARALELVPELAENFTDTAATLRSVNPALGEAMTRAAAAWPRLVPADELLGAAGLAAIADDPMLLGVLRTTPVRDVGLEWLLTSVRAALLRRAADGPDAIDAATLTFACALARQCFNNEYVFAASPDESARLAEQCTLLIDALEQGAVVPPLRVAAVASYRALAQVPGALRLLDGTWLDAVDELLTQQVRDADEERRLADAMPRLTAIEGEGTAAVRRQYEENPYPRWVVAPSQPEPMTVDGYLRSRFPLSPFRPLGERAGMDILIAGCGTGEHSIGTARRYRDAKVLAIDLSLSSLAYAERKTRGLGLRNIEYAQADVMALPSIGRSFDVIDASGVLHHLADPMAGWRGLLSLLRPGGLIRVGLYSELGRADIVAARQFIAERGFDATADGIRRCRQALLESPLRTLTRYPDFFSTSGCRDLVFHVREHRLAIQRIAELLTAEKLAFIGFELDAGALRDYRARYPADPAMTDLSNWDAFERDRPATFASMYQFWCQRR